MIEVNFKKSMIKFVNVQVPQILDALNTLSEKLEKHTRSNVFQFCERCEFELTKKCAGCMFPREKTLPTGFEPKKVIGVELK
jgi:hypothetical protein